MAGQPFRQCRMCGATWFSWQEFISDPSVQLVGLQAVPKIPTANVMVFNHDRCGSLSILTSKLRPLLGQPEQDPEHEEECDGCFRDLDDLAQCQKKCVIAADRHLTLDIWRQKR